MARRGRPCRPRTIRCMRYEARAYGTRQEIIEHITEASLTPGRSDRRMREGARAVIQLEDGDDQVQYGNIVFVVADD